MLDSESAILPHRCVFYDSAARCLFFAWFGQFGKSEALLQLRWRMRLVTLGVRFATLSQIISIVSLSHFLHIGHPPGPHPSTPPWLLSNWTALLAWVFAVGAGSIGNGRSRLALLLWAATFAFATYFVAMNSFD